MARGHSGRVVLLREWADGSSVEVLAEAMRVSHSRARACRRLEAAGLARREPDPSDGRRALVWLEPAGRELAERALDACSRVPRSAVAELDAAEVRDLDRLLGALLDRRPSTCARRGGRAGSATRRPAGIEGACPVTGPRTDESPA